jgi:hypothetical protein
MPHSVLRLNSPITPIKRNPTMKLRLCAASALALMFAPLPPAFAETCALDDPNFVPPANDLSRPADGADDDVINFQTSHSAPPS